MTKLCLNPLFYLLWELLTILSHRNPACLLSNGFLPTQSATDMNKVNITQLMLTLDTFFSPKDLHSKIQIPGWPAMQDDGMAKLNTPLFVTASFPEWCTKQKSQMTSKTAKNNKCLITNQLIHLLSFIVQENSADTTLSPFAHLRHCQLSTVSCKHQRRTIKHSIGPTTCSAHNGPETINSLYFTTAHPLKVSGIEKAIVWLRQAFTQTAGISSHAQSFRSALSGPCWPAGGLCFSGNQKP